MDATVGHAAGDVTGAVLADPRRFSLLQALHLLEGASHDLNDHVRLRPAPALSFPTGDIRAGRIDHLGRLELEVSCLGLIGVDAAMPHQFLDASVCDTPSALRLRDFLSIFNHRLYLLFYRAWCSGRLDFAGATGFPGPLHPFDSLRRPAESGSGPQGSTAPGERSCGASRLTALVMQTTGLGCVQVDDRLADWIPIPNGFALGGDNPLRLAETVVLGDRLFVAGSHVRVSVGPVPVDHAPALFPEQDTGKRLLRLLRRYSPNHQSVQLRIIIESTPRPLPALGRDCVCIGRNTWVGGGGSRVGEVQIVARGNA